MLTVRRLQTIAFTPASTSSSPPVTRASFSAVSFPSLHVPHSLKQIDIEFMRRLHTRVNLIPVIAKADTLTDEEIVDFKARVRTIQCFCRTRADQSSRFLLTLLTTRFKFSRHLPTKMKTRKLWLKQRKLRARFLSPWLVQTMSFRLPTAVKSAAVRTHGVL